MHDWFFTLFSWRRGQQVGVDSFGNRYYQTRKSFRKKQPIKRWVVYKGLEEASKVPAEWHGWLHYRTDELPSLLKAPYSWQKPHLPNLTGTSLAYTPQTQNVLYPALKTPSKDYEPWTP
jgi:NADH:ubiquinone oxidoreductase subunit